MTENNNVSEIASSNVISQPESNVNVNVPANTPSRSYSEEEVNKIVGGKKQKAYDQGYETARNELLKQQNTVTQQPTTNPSQQSFGGMPQMSQADLDKLVTDKVQSIAQQQQQQAHNEYWQQQGQEIASQINAKLEKGKALYDDYDKVVTPGAVKDIANVALLANKVDNTADVMYDLMKNPSKLIQIETLLDKARNEKSQYHLDLANQMLRDLSTSITANKTAAANQPHINKPLSQVNPSNVGADNGSRTVSDIRKNPKYRV